MWEPEGRHLQVPGGKMETLGEINTPRKGIRKESFSLPTEVDLKWIKGLKQAWESREDYVHDSAQPELCFAPPGRLQLHSSTARQLFLRLLRRVNCFEINLNPILTPKSIP